MKSITAEIPDLARLITPFESVDAKLGVPDLHKLVMSRPETLCLPVKDKGKVIGVIFSRAFLKQMSWRYMRDISQRKTAADVAHNAYFRVQLGDKITDVLSALLKHDPRLELDSIAVFDKSELVGIVSIAALMLAISDTQKQLIERLDEMGSRLRSEVSITAQLQRNLMPSEPLNVNDYKVHATLLTCTEVGGDFYDYFMIDNRYMVLAIGDASGHGVPAGMLVAAAKAALHTLPKQLATSPPRVLQHMNNAIISTGLTERLMTFFYMVIDVKKHQAVYCNAAQNFPYHLDAANKKLVSLCDASGLPLGLEESVEYEEHKLSLGPDDRLFFYTDGLVEEQGPDESDYGYERLEEVLTPLVGKEADIMEAVLGDFNRFVNSEHRSDDITLLTVTMPSTGTRGLPGGALMLLKSMAETQECRTETWLRQKGFPIVDGIAPEAVGQTTHDVPLMTQNFFDSMIHHLPLCVPGEAPIMIAERAIRTQIGNLRSIGIHRVLQWTDPVLAEIGIDTLLRGNDRENFISLSRMFDGVQTEYVTHTAEKETVIEKILGYADEIGFSESRPDLSGALALVLDEMLENAFLASPSNVDRHLRKGEQRELDESHVVEVTYGHDERMLAISVSDPYGLFDSTKLLEHFERHCYGIGIQSGKGGAGLYLIWRFSDYLHINLIPQQRTTFTVFFCNDGPVNPEVDKSFQLTIT